MNALNNTSNPLLSMDTTTTRPYYYNLTPLMVLVAVCAVIIFCCVCLTSYNSFMKHKHKQQQQQAISYGEQDQHHLKFGSIFMTYMPGWMSQRINKASALNNPDEEQSDCSDITAERELLLSLSRVHYFSCKESNDRLDNDNDSNRAGSSCSDALNSRLQTDYGEEKDH